MTHGTPNEHPAEDKQSDRADLDGAKPLPAGAIGREREDPERLINPFAQIAMGDIRRAYEPLSDRYPPMLNLSQAAEIAGVATSTLKPRLRGQV